MLSMSHADEVSNPQLLSVEHALRRCNEERYQRRQKRIEYNIFIASLSEQKVSRRSSAPPVNTWQAPLPISIQPSNGSPSTRSSISSFNSLRSSVGIASKRTSLSSLETTFSSLSLSGSSVKSFASSKSRLDLAQTRRSTILEGLLEYRDHFLPARFFRTLPEQIYDNILNQLRIVHFGKNKAGCVECYLRDLRSLSRTSRAWQRLAEKHMFEVLYISKSHITSENKILKSKSTSRLKLLRSKLRSRSDLAKHVRVLRIDADVMEFYHRASLNDKTHIIDAFASLVMACPNLNRLEGFYLEYDQTFDRLSQALASRSQLTERIWRLSAPAPSIRRVDDNFLNHSDLWSASLTSLVLQGPGTEGCVDYRAFVGTFRKLPRLKRLVIANFAAQDFHDRTMAALPAVTSLRLERLPGVSDKGVARFAGSAAAKAVRNLTLINLDIKNIGTVSDVLERLDLKRFSLQQDPPPACPLDPAIEVLLLGSPTLEYLHWDVLTLSPTHDFLFDSIAAGNFPSLHQIRCINDHNGLLQSVCRPAAQAILNSDDHLIHRTSKRTSAIAGLRSLMTVRRTAQDRIDEARSRPVAKIIVEEDGRVQSIHEIGGFIGQIGSAIDFMLEPDIEGSDTALAQVDDIFEGYGKGGLIKAPVCGGGVKQEWSHKARFLCVQVDTNSLF